MIREEDLHPIGKFTKPHGIKGEISLVTDYDLADISGFEHSIDHSEVNGKNHGEGDITSFIVCEMDGIWVPFFIDSYREKNNTTTLVKFENLDSEESVKLLMGKTAYVPSAWLPSSDTICPEGRLEFADYTLVDAQLGTIGQITNVNDSTMNILLLVDYKGIELLVPAALVTSVQPNRKIVHVSLPEGFLAI
jgi:16S rRNA processing protein RimM